MVFNTPSPWKHVSTDMLQTPPTPPTPRNRNVKTMKQSMSCPVVADKEREASSNVAALLKPFFLMDWLDQVDPDDLELARQMLHTPKKLEQTPKQFTFKPLLSPSNSETAGVLSEPSPEGDPTQKQRQQTPPTVLSPTSVMDKESSKDDVRRRLYLPTPSSDEHDRDANQEAAIPNQLPLPEEALALHLDEAVPLPPALSMATMSTFKKRSIGIGNGWNAKGLHKAKKGKWEEALLCWANALEIRAQVLGDDHQDVANTCNNMGIALGKLGRFTEAMKKLERALDIRTSHYGTREHPEVAATVHNMGNVLHQAQDRAGAIQYYWDAKLIQEQTLGPNHIQVARSCVSIGNVYYEAMQYEDAREAYLDALHIFARAGLKKNHDEVVAVMQDLQEMESLRVPNTPYVPQQQHHHPQQQQPNHHHQLYPQHPQLHPQSHPLR